MVIIVVVLSIIIGIAVPEVLNGSRTTKAATCGAALRAIETAKGQFKRDFPGYGDPTPAQLTRYFPGGLFPTDPWNVGFELHLESGKIPLDTPATHIYNGNCQFEPRDNCSQTNGYNDSSPLVGM